MLAIYLVSVLLALFFSFTAGYVGQKYRGIRSATRREIAQLVLIALIPLIHWALLWVSFDETLKHPWFNK